MAKLHCPHKCMCVGGGWGGGGGSPKGWALSCLAKRWVQNPELGEALSQLQSGNLPLWILLEVNQDVWVVGGKMRNSL